MFHYNLLMKQKLQEIKLINKKQMHDSNTTMIVYLCMSGMWSGVNLRTNTCAKEIVTTCSQYAHHSICSTINLIIGAYMTTLRARKILQFDKWRRHSYELEQCKWTLQARFGFVNHLMLIVWLSMCYEKHVYPSHTTHLMYTTYDI